MLSLHASRAVRSRPNAPLFAIRSAVPSGHRGRLASPKRSMLTSTGNNASSSSSPTPPTPSPQQPGGHRTNVINLQMISASLYSQLFPNAAPHVNDLAESLSHLKTHNLAGLTAEALPDIDGWRLPPLQGSNIEHHFRVVGSSIAEPYMSHAIKFAAASYPPEMQSSSVSSPAHFRTKDWLDWPRRVALPEAELAPFKTSAANASSSANTPLSPFPSPTHFDIRWQLPGDAVLPRMPQQWSRAPGWTRYSRDGATPTSVPYPDLDDAMLSFDVEVCVQEGNFPVLATAVSLNAWYSWVSPDFVPFLDGSYKREATGQKRPVISTLIPFGNVRQRAPPTGEGAAALVHGPPRLVVGHRVSYDRARILDEYRIDDSTIRFLDTYSLHMCVVGDARKRKTKTFGPSAALDDGDETPATQLSPSGKVSSATLSLSDLLKFHFHEELDKEVRNTFVTGSLEDIAADFSALMTYCANDSFATYRLYSRLLPLYFHKCPHPASFAGMLEMNSCYLPIDTTWRTFIEQCQEKHDVLQNKLESHLQKLAMDALELKQIDPATGRPLYEADPWLKNLDWSQKEVQMTKEKVGKDGRVLQPARPKKNQRLPGLPKWFVNLCPPGKSTPDKLSTRTQLTPYLLKLTWHGYPLRHSPRPGLGWGFVAPALENVGKKYKVACRVPDIPTVLLAKEESDLDTAGEDELSASVFENNEHEFEHTQLVDATAKPDLKDLVDFCRIPHRMGDEFNCGNPLSKDYLSKFSSGVLGSKSLLAEEAIKTNIFCSYWISVQRRVKSQFAAFQNELLTSGNYFPLESDAAGAARPVSGAKNALAHYGRLFGQLPRSAVCHSPPPGEAPLDNGVILPMVVTAGTVTRRAVEPTWMTASNAKKDRIGSEVKVKVVAPRGYHLVGADVDSEELWIAALFGDARFGFHGSTALGWMTLAGSKNNGSDMHSKSASILKISRDQAKIFNYARIYGAGVTFAAKQLQSDSAMSAENARAVAEQLYASTKGRKQYTVKDPLSKTDVSVVLEDLPKSLQKRTRQAVMQKPHRMSWIGGTESYTFNRLEETAVSAVPRTPALGCEICEVLHPRNAKNSFMTSRVNWVVQSSGVDYLHLLLVSMKWLIRTYGLNARLCLTIHDEVRFLTRDDDTLRASLALQVSNLWTRTLFSYQVGVFDLPQSVAFFSAVDVDVVMRKEAKAPCVTPSQPNPLPSGVALDVYQLLAMTENGLALTDAEVAKRAPKLVMDIDARTMRDLPEQASVPAATPPVDASAVGVMNAVDADADLDEQLSSELANERLMEYEEEEGLSLAFWRSKKGKTKTKEKAKVEKKAEKVEEKVDEAKVEKKAEDKAEEKVEDKAEDKVEDKVEDKAKAEDKAKDKVEDKAKDKVEDKAQETSTSAGKKPANPDRKRGAKKKEAEQEKQPEEQLPLKAEGAGKAKKSKTTLADAEMDSKPSKRKRKPE